MKIGIWFSLLFLVLASKLTATQPLIEVRFKSQSVEYSGSWKVRVVDKLARQWVTPDVPADHTSLVTLDITPFDNIVAMGLYEIQIVNNLVGCHSHRVTFIKSVTVNFRSGKSIVFNKISPSVSGQMVQVSFLVSPDDID